MEFVVLILFTALIIPFAISLVMFGRIPVINKFINKIFDFTIFPLIIFFGTIIGINTLIEESGWVPNIWFKEAIPTISVLITLCILIPRNNQTGEAVPTETGQIRKLFRMVTDKLSVYAINPTVIMISHYLIIFLVFEIFRLHHTGSLILMLAIITTVCEYIFNLSEKFRTLILSFENKSG